MSDRLLDAFHALRAGGATFAGPVRVTHWSQSPRGMTVSFRLDVAEDPADNPATHPFGGCYCSAKEGDRFMLLVIPVANPDAGSPDGRAADLDSARAGSTPAPAIPDEAGPPRAAAGERRHSTRCALVCQEGAFWRYLSERFGRPVTNEAEAAALVRDHCGVASRAELDAPGPAQERWRAIDSDYRIWLRI